MAKPEPSMDAWLAEAKQSDQADQCGMFLVHNGIVRVTPKKQVREGVQGIGDVTAVQFSYDEAGVEAAIEESIMYVLIGADIRPNCIDALQKLVGHIKNDLVIEKEIYA